MTALGAISPNFPGFSSLSPNFTANSRCYRKCTVLARISTGSSTNGYPTTTTTTPNKPFPGLLLLSLSRAQTFYTNSCDTDEKNRQYIKYVTPPVNCVTSVCIKKLCKKISRPSIFRKLILQFKSSTNQMKRNAYNTLGGYCKWTQRFGSCNIRKHIVFCFVCKKS